MSTTGARTGRTPKRDGIASNREQILAAARAEFGAKGFRGTTMRAIATRAGFDVALLSHYFANKDGLFAATLELPEDTGEKIAAALGSSPAVQGELLTRGYLELWENPATGAQMQVLGRSALSNADAPAHIRALLTGASAGTDLDALLAGRRLGFTLAMSHLLGVAVTRYLTQLPTLAELDFDTLVERTAPAVHLHLSTPDDATRRAT